MATAAKPARKANYTAIGTAGRKTGIQIQDTGERTEDGFEKMEAFFSPTTAGGRTPARNGFDDDEEESAVYGTPQRTVQRAPSKTMTSGITSGSAMDLQSSSTAPDPLTALSVRNGSPSRQLLRAGSVLSNNGDRRSSVVHSSPQRLPPNRSSVDPFGRDRTRSASPPKRPDTGRGISPFKEAKSPYSVRSTALPPPRQPLFGGGQRAELPVTQEEPDLEEEAPTQPEEDSNRNTPQNTPPRKKAPPRHPNSEIPSSPLTPRPASKPKGGKLMSLGKLPAPLSSPPQSEPELIPEDDANDFDEDVTPRTKSLKKSALPPPKIPKVKKVVSKAIDSDEEAPPAAQKSKKLPAKPKQPTPVASDVSDYEDAEEPASPKPAKTNGMKPAKQTKGKGKAVEPELEQEAPVFEEDEEPVLPYKKPSQKKSQEKEPKAQSRRGKNAPKPHKAVTPDASEEEEPVQPTRKPASKKARKAPVVEEEVAEEPVQQPKKPASKKTQKAPVEDATEDEDAEEPVRKPAKKAPSKKAQKPAVVQEISDDEELELPEQQPQKKPTKNTGRAAAATKKKQRETVTIEDSPDLDEEVVEPAPKKTGRKPSAAASKKAPVVEEEEAAEEVEEFEDEPELSVEEPPAAKSKGRKKKTTEKPEASSSSASRGSKRSRQEEEDILSDQDSAPQTKEPATAKATSAKASKAKASKPASNKRKVLDDDLEPADDVENVESSSKQPAARASPKRRKVSAKEKTKRVPASTNEEPVDHPAPASHAAVVRKEKPPSAVIPQEDLGKRRSHRSRVEPLAFWRNEKAVYKLAERRASIGTIAMPVMQEIIRVEEPEQKPKRKPAARSNKKAKKKIEESEDEWDEDDLQDWEKEDGVFEGLIRVYPPNEEDPDMMISEELAITAERIEPQSLPNGNFALCKTVSKSFMGTGIIVLPPGGEKRTKNSGKMHIIMYVIAGRVEVQIGDNVFKMRKGGQFSIPRGNLYSIANPWDRPARLFFAQGLDTAQL